VLEKDIVGPGFVEVKRESGIHCNPMILSNLLFAMLYRT
jgi:hypothetical protein